jgi:hypothetical protein
MSERLRNIDETGIFERTGSFILGILGWSNTVRNDLKTKKVQPKKVLIPVQDADDR